MSLLVGRWLVGVLSRWGAAPAMECGGVSGSHNTPAWALCAVLTVALSSFSGVAVAAEASSCGDAASKHPPLRAAPFLPCMIPTSNLLKRRPILHKAQLEMKIR